jgi:hypothetical protein
MARIGVLINPMTNIGQRKPAFTSLSRRQNTPIPCAIQLRSRADGQFSHWQRQKKLLNTRHVPG